MKRREFLTKTGIAGTGLALVPSAGAKHRAGQSQAYQPSALIGWNVTVTSAIAAARFAPTTAARALAMVYEAVFNAWACYDSHAAFTLSGLRKRLGSERRTDNKTIAVSEDRVFKRTFSPKGSRPEAHRAVLGFGTGLLRVDRSPEVRHS